MKTRYFLSAAFFAIATSAIVLADSFREYEAEMSVMVIPRSEVSAASIGTIVLNMEHIAGTDFFRSMFFRALSEKDGSSDDLSATMRGEAMDKMVAVRAEENGSVISVKAVSSDADDAKSVVGQATFSLFDAVGRYYDLKKDIDLRITEGPTMSARITSPVSFVLSSVALGVSVTTVFFLTLFGFPEAVSFFERKRRFVRKTLDAKVFEPEMPTSPLLRDTIETDREEAAAVIAEQESVLSDVPEQVTVAEVVTPVSPTHEKKGAAPSNLPSLSEAEEQFLREFSFEGSLEQEEAEEMKEAVTIAPLAPSTEPIADHEPTEAEYKRRLNELLRG